MTRARRPRKGHRDARYRYARKLDRSRLAVELRRSIWPEFWPALAASEPAPLRPTEAQEAGS